MSGKGKKSGRKSTSKPIGDVTINDFANATKCTNRAKKSVHSVTTVIKQLEIDNRAWDEKTDEFDGDFDFVEEENEAGEKIFVIQRQPRKKTVSHSDLSARNGVTYPLDIWFLISEFIRPEDVGRFAGICKCTHAVINSAKFWFSLYKRHYKITPSLPERLQPECMVRLYGLKACVTRALFFTYAPFIERLKTTFEEHPHILLKRQCVLMWHKKRKNKWLYYFKLKEQTTLMKKTELTNKPDLIEMLEDVCANYELNCRILQVTCPHFIPISPIMGLTLSSVSLTLSQGFRSHRLQLGFGSGLSYAMRSPDVATSVEITLDPVINVKVLDWWHPLYPHAQTTPFLLNHE